MQFCLLQISSLTYSSRTERPSGTGLFLFSGQSEKQVTSLHTLIGNTPVSCYQDLNFETKPLPELTVNCSNKSLTPIIYAAFIVRPRLALQLKLLVSSNMLPSGVQLGGWRMCDSIYH